MQHSALQARAEAAEARANGLQAELRSVVGQLQVCDVMDLSLQFWACRGFLIGADCEQLPGPAVLMHPQRGINGRFGRTFATCLAIIFQRS